MRLAHTSSATEAAARPSINRTTAMWVVALSSSKTIAAISRRMVFLAPFTRRYQRRSQSARPCRASRRAVYSACATGDAVMVAPASGAEGCWAAPSVRLFARTQPFSRKSRAPPAEKAKAAARKKGIPTLVRAGRPNTVERARMEGRSSFAPGCDEEKPGNSGHGSAVPRTLGQNAIPAFPVRPQDVLVGFGRVAGAQTNRVPLELLPCPIGHVAQVV